MPLDADAYFVAEGEFVPATYWSLATHLGVAGSEPTARSGAIRRWLESNVPSECLIRSLARNGIEA